MKNWVQVIRKKAPYRIETAISKAQNVVHVWTGTFQAKNILGPIFKKSGWIIIKKQTLSLSDQEKTPYWIKNAFSKAQKVVSHLDLGWHLSSKIILGTIF